MHAGLGNNSRSLMLSVWIVIGLDSWRLLQSLAVCIHTYDYVYIHACMQTLYIAPFKYLSEKLHSLALKFIKNNFICKQLRLRLLGKLPLAESCTLVQPNQQVPFQSWHHSYIHVVLRMSSDSWTNCTLLELLEHVISFPVVVKNPTEFKCHILVLLD